MTRYSRRQFLKQSALTGIAATFAISGTKASGRILGANERVRIAVAGIHGRGGQHISAFASMPDVDVVYLVDPDSRLFKARIQQVKKLGKNTPLCVQDIRKALDDSSLDAVSVATPNHWHSLITVWACQAGKHVYVEKPCSHDPFEGRQCVEAAKKYKRVVQHGTQSRSSASWAKTVAAVRSGKYGKLLVAKGYASKPGKGRWTVGFQPPKDVPAELNYDLWLGPAQVQPYNENLVHYNWHWFWDFGNGEIGNQGVHQMDIARWGIGKKWPQSVISIGRRYTIDVNRGYIDQAQTPNMQITVFDFDGVLLLFEVMSLCGKSPITGKRLKGKVTNEFYLEEGKNVNGRFFPKGSDKSEPLPDVDYELHGTNHFRNFIDCVKAESPEKLNAPIEEGHYSAALCHLGNISYRAGWEVSGKQEPVGLPDNPLVHESFERFKKVLRDFLDIDLAQHSYRLGAKLQFDPQTEQFIGDDYANELLHRKYRRPYVVPQIG